MVLSSVNSSTRPLVSLGASPHPSYCRRENAFKRHMRVPLIEVKITYMNRIINGIGVKNDCGGIEFFNEEYKLLRTSSTSSYINDLRNQAMYVEHEIFSLSNLIEHQKDKAVKWREKYDELTAHLMSIDVSFENLAEQGRQGLINMDKSESNRQKLIKLRSRLLKELAETKTLIDGDCKNKKRLSFLKVYISEIYGSLELKERALFVTNTYTIGHPGLLTIPLLKGVTSRKCCLFWDICDYMAYIYLLNCSRTSKLPSLSDVIILNDPRNLLSLLVNIDTYDHIYCFFPHTAAGVLLCSAVKERQSDCVTDISGCFKPYVSLYRFALALDFFIPNTAMP